MKLMANSSAADLIVESCHPIRRAGPTAVRDLVLGPKTSHLVFPGGIGIGRTLRNSLTSLSLRLGERERVGVTSLGQRDREGEPALQQADHEPLLRLGVFSSQAVATCSHSTKLESQKKNTRPKERDSMRGCGRDQVTRKGNQGSLP
jgi:hypothetical protein